MGGQCDAAPLTDDVPLFRIMLLSGVLSSRGGFLNGFVGLYSFVC
jgi:hypothetical protein